MKVYEGTSKFLIFWLFKFFNSFNISLPAFVFSTTKSKSINAIFWSLKELEIPKNKKKSIKNLLLYQRFVSGIGNIYANEILFQCKINPLKESNKLNEKEISNLVNYSKLILNLSIKFGGSSIKDFKNAKGISGLFQNNFKVYNREDKNCVRKNCNGKIIKIFISNRSSFICKSCQK